MSGKSLGGRKVLDGAGVQPIEWETDALDRFVLREALTLYAARHPGSLVGSLARSMARSVADQAALAVAAREYRAPERVR